MVKSMTGFGRSNINQNSCYSFSVEIKSVNHRYLDLNIKMPKSILSLEHKIRAMISQKLSRGKVDIFITNKNYEESHNEAILNTALCDSYMKCLKEISERYGIYNDIPLSLISKFPDVIKVEEKEVNLDSLWEVLKENLSNALDNLVAMREDEGEKLKSDILLKSLNIKKIVDDISIQAPCVVEQYKLRLTQRLTTLNNSIPIDENRIATEIAIFADKASIDEEITRLYSHINQLSSTLDLEEPIGRKLDFIVQEMNREANTIASKSQNIEITNMVLNVKNEIEKIREQVQNIE